MGITQISFDKDLVSNSYRLLGNIVGFLQDEGHENFEINSRFADHCNRIIKSNGSMFTFKNFLFIHSKLKDSFGFEIVKANGQNFERGDFIDYVTQNKNTVGKRK
jgi:hypothetical protein